MPSASRTPPLGGSFSRRFTHYSGIFFDDFATDSAWLRENGQLRLPPLDGITALILRGEFRPHPAAGGLESAPPELSVSLNGAFLVTLRNFKPGPWEIRLPLPAPAPTSGFTLALRLSGTGLTDTLAWLGRITGLAPLQRFRAQNKNRALRLTALAADTG
jgi:hypothetical protein